MLTTVPAFGQVTDKPIEAKRRKQQFSQMCLHLDKQLTNIQYISNKKGEHLVYKRQERGAILANVPAFERATDKPLE